MAKTDDLLTVREAQEILRTNGVDWTTVWIRMQIGAGKIKSVKIFNARLIHRSEVSRIIRERRAAW